MFAGAANPVLRRTGELIRKFLPSSIKKKIKQEQEEKTERIASADDDEASGNSPVVERRDIEAFRIFIRLTDRDKNLKKNQAALRERKNGRDFFQNDSSNRLARINYRSL